MPEAAGTSRLVTLMGSRSAICGPPIASLDRRSARRELIDSAVPSFGCIGDWLDVVERELGKPALGVQNRLIELGEPLWVVEEVRRDDLPASDRDRPHRERFSMRQGDASDGTVDESRPACSFRRS